MGCKGFFCPKITKKYCLRVAIVAIIAYIVFGFLCNPFIIDGESMMPTYPKHGCMLSWNGAYWFKPPAIGDVIIARFNSRIAYLKRIVALPGDTVQWIDGTLYRNGEPMNEPYVKYSSNWNSELITVEPAHVYVVGDNRGMNRDEHKHGQLKINRIIGVPLW